MRWAQRKRQELIADMLEVLGWVNRKHLCAAFGISQQQASKDLQAFLRENPGAMRYNLHTKRYERLTTERKEDQDRSCSLLRRQAG